MWGWSEEETERFLRSQYQCQLKSYESTYGDLKTYVIAADGYHVGRVMIGEAEDSLALIDLAVLAPFRNRGIGTNVLRLLQSDVSKLASSIRLSVRHGNPARRLYERMNFVEKGHDELNAYMVWSPSDSISKRCC